MNAIDGLTIALVIISVLALFLFVWVFEKIGENKRTIEYESDRQKYWHDRWDVIDGKMSKLYAKDQHNFERPRVDLLTEMITRQDERHDKRLSELYQKVYNLKTESKKEVKG